jgi:restriction endonuclease S subunit
MEAWSEVKLSALAPGFRIDPEFYRPEFLVRESELSHLPCISLERLAYVTDGEHGSVPYTENGVRYLTAENVCAGYVDIMDVRYVDEWVNARNARAIVQPGNILISIKGTLGQVAVAEQWLLPANMNRDVAVIKIRSKQLASEFLAAFLMSRFGQFQALREGSGGVQQMITLGRLRTIKVPLVNPKAQEEVVLLWQRAAAQRRLSNTIYTSAQRILEKALKLNSIDLSGNLSHESRLSTIFNARRWDAQHYRPKYDILLEAIRAAPSHRALKDMLTYNQRGVQPDYVPGGPIAVVNSQHIGPQHCFHQLFERTSKEALVSAGGSCIRKNDILLYTTGAYVGRTNIFLEEIDAVASNHVNILRLRNDYDPAYVALVLNSPVGLLQTEKYTTGSTQAELYPSAIARFCIPLIASSTTKTIGDKVRISYDLLRESSGLLEQAKRRVEELIEKGRRN